MRFNPAYFERVRDGLKTQTVRFDDPVEVGPAWLVFEFDDGYRRLPGVIEQVTTRRLNELDDDDARREGASSIAALRAGLRGHYPSLGGDAEVSVVSFRVPGDS